MLSVVGLGIAIVVGIGFVLFLISSVLPPEPGSLKARELEIQAKVLVGDEITRADIEVLLQMESPVLDHAVALHRAQKNS